MTRSHRPPRRGSIVPLVALALIPMLGVVAIAVDGGLLMSDRRAAQRIADSAALAAATDLYTNWNTTAGADTNGTAKKSALTTAAANGFNNDGVTSVVTVNIPPTSGTFSGQTGYAEVRITYNQSRLFSSIWGSAALAVKARSVARGRWHASPIGILVLNPTKNGALTITGSAGMTVKGSVIVDSSSSTAAVSSGSAGLTSTELDITGNKSSSGSSYFHADTIKTGVKPTPDPLASMTVPDPATMTIRSTTTYKPTSGEVLQPGVYTGGISISSKPNVTLAPGIYYLQGGGFVMSGGSSTLYAHEVMLYNGQGSSGTTGNITVSGGGTVDMTPPASGTYNGMAIFQDRTSTKTVTLSGGSTWNFVGTVYAAAAHVDVSGSSGAKMGSQYISDTLTLSGSSTFQDIDPGGGPLWRDITLVE